MDKTSLTLPLLGLTLASTMPAQWSPTSSSHLAVADGPSAQAQPLVLPRADGGCYVSWLDSDPNGSPAYGYDVRLQRLDSSGREQWAHGGVLVADRGFSSTQTYGLDVDAMGRAVLAFRDDRGTGTQITAALVDAKGTLLWGTTGIQLTNTTASVAKPQIAATTDGNYVVAWTEGNSVYVQKLGQSGVPFWPAAKILQAPGANLVLSDMHASTAGGVILALQRDTGFSTPSHLYAQKLDIVGTLLWGANHLAVFDGGSLQTGNYPSFVPDGSGGAVFGWYSSAPSLECYAQQVLASGTEVFKHNGITASTNTANRRTAPSVSFDPVTQSIVLVYRELSGSATGVSAQKFDKLGNRLWTATGIGIAPLGTLSIADVKNLAVQGGVMAFWTAAPSWAQDQVYSATLDSAGNVVVKPSSVSSKPATKYRVQAALSSLGFAMLAWQDEGAGNPDIHAQNVLPDGRLGGVASATARNGSKVNPMSYTSVTMPVIGGNWETSVALPPAAFMTGVFFSLSPSPGLIVPPLGEVLIRFPEFYLHGVMSGGKADSHIFPIPKSLALVGIKLSTQAVTIAGGSVQLCNAIDIVIGV